MSKNIPSSFRARLCMRLAKISGACIAALVFCMATGTVVHAVEAQVAQQHVQAVNINEAGVEELATLAGIGEGKALAIIEHREINGAFASVEQLTEVKGIGEATVDKNRARISL